MSSRSPRRRSSRCSSAGAARLNADTKQYLYLDPWTCSTGPARCGTAAWSRRRRHPPGHRLPLADGPVLRPHGRAGRSRLGRPAPLGRRAPAPPALGALGPVPHAAAPPPGCTSPRRAAYGLSPFVLGHVTGQSGCSCRSPACRGSCSSWRRPLDARGLAVAGALRAHRHDVRLAQRQLGVLRAPRRLPVGAFRGWGHELRGATGARALAPGLLTLVTQLWWLVAYAVGGEYNLPILALTENVRTDRRDTGGRDAARPRVLVLLRRRHQGPWLGGIAPPYQTSGCSSSSASPSP